MNSTKIEYIDFTWNPAIGCTGIGCAVRKICWARGQAKRRKGKCEGNRCYLFVPHYHYERFRQPLLMKKPSRIGMGFMADIFDSGFAICPNEEIFDIMGQAYWHKFLTLTKQSQNMHTFFTDWKDCPDNVAVGVSVNRPSDLYRLEDLRNTDVSTRVVSFEPLYDDLGEVNLDGIDWVIIGGQTRPKWEPTFSIISDLIKQVDKKDIPVFIKKNITKYVRRQEYPKKWG